MQPGTYRIPASVQVDLRIIAEHMEKRASQRGGPLSDQQRAAVAAIAERITMLAEFKFNNGNEMYLMKPAMTLGYARMGCDQIKSDRQFPSEEALEAARRVRDWLDAIGHVYPRRP